MFPDTDPINRGRDSAEMLRTAVEAVAGLGWQIANIDCIIDLERPKIRPYRQAISQRVAEILGIEPERVGLKAKTGEGVGPVGRHEAVSAQCVALLETRTPD